MRLPEYSVIESLKDAGRRNRDIHHLIEQNTTLTRNIPIQVCFQVSNFFALDQEIGFNSFQVRVPKLII